MRTYIEDLKFVYNKIKKDMDEKYKDCWFRPDIKIYSIEIGEDEIIDREFLKQKYKVDGIAVKRIKKTSIFELMDI